METFVKNIFLLLGILCSTGRVYATELQYTLQHVHLKKQKQSGWQHDVFAKTHLTPKLEAGVMGSYIERYSLYETTYGGMLGYRFTKDFYLEGSYTQGIGNQLLTERESMITMYYSLVPGISPFITLKDSRYSDTTVDGFTLGSEIEKWPHLLLIPQFMLGNSKFKGNGTKESIYSYGLRAIYYTEDKYSIYLYGSKGLEASQGITGAANLRVHSTTGGVGGSYYIFHNLKADLSVDHTDYRELKNQFITTTFSLGYKF